jgi:cephalosporin-C deacetylase-like acetyl esterase
MKARRICLALVVLVLWRLSIVLREGLAADALPATNASTAMIHNFLRQEARRLDAQFLDGITNKVQWEAQRGELRQEYLETLGLWPMPERTALQPQVTGVIERDEGFRVEKLHFQSRPHLYVTGNLYLPKEAKAGAKLPAVLYVCGHSGRGRDGNKTAFQHHGMWFATHGYACLLIDTLQLGEIAAIHHGTYRYGRWWWQARGYTPAAVECWNGIRAIDYLQNRSEVDPERIAVTGISGGGAATFWIAAADERVKVAVPVSGMSDLEDYVGEKVVNGHCDCMFLINTFQRPWTDIAALVAPRPLLFENSGHDTIFPMNGNDRIRARLEKLYGLYTNRTDRLFDIGVMPGGHDDKVELRLMAYRWINRFLKGDDKPVTEPELPSIEGKLLRAFPDELPADELNTKIDESFVLMATNALPTSAKEFEAWRTRMLSELQRTVFRGVLEKASPEKRTRLSGYMNASPSTFLSSAMKNRGTGTLPTEPGIAVSWKYFRGNDAALWLVVLDEDESIENKPEWLNKIAGDASALLLAPRGNGPMRWSDPAPYYIQRSMPLLGRTVDTCRLIDTLVVASDVLDTLPHDAQKAKIVGRGRAGVIAAYAALFEPRLTEVIVVDPPPSHRDGPTFLNVLRVIDVPDALGLLAPRSLTIRTSRPEAFSRTASIYQAVKTDVRFQPSP